MLGVGESVQRLTCGGALRVHSQGLSPHCLHGERMNPGDMQQLSFLPHARRGCQILTQSEGDLRNTDTHIKWTLKTQRSITAFLNTFSVHHRSCCFKSPKWSVYCLHLSPITKTVQKLLSVTHDQVVENVTSLQWHHVVNPCQKQHDLTSVFPCLLKM